MRALYFLRLFQKASAKDLWCKMKCTLEATLHVFKRNFQHISTDSFGACRYQ